MIRPMVLARQGWYPSDNIECEKEIKKYVDHNLFIEGRKPISVIVPHAGWYFCGHLSVNCIRILKEKNGNIKNIFIFGGHLHESNLGIIETFDYAQTPFGNLKNNTLIKNYLKDEPFLQPAPYIEDNTIEVLLPIIYYFFGGEVTITALYLPPHFKTISLVQKLYKRFGTTSVFIGSTDLTHYGPNYAFISHDKSMAPVEWVKNVNDKKYIDLLLNFKDEESVEFALKNSSACSSGAALGALTAAIEANVEKSDLIGYATSYDKHKASSFVGYAGIIY